MAVAFGVAALVGLDPLSGVGEFVIAALAGGAVYGLILIVFDAAKRRFGGPEAILESQSVPESEPSRRKTSRIVMGSGD